MKTIPAPPRLVKLPDGNLVNPAFVTCIELKVYERRSETVLWCVGHAGYGTTSFSFPGDQRKKLAELIDPAPETKQAGKQ